MKTLKYSRHREAILKFLSSRYDHPTAEVIYQNLRAEFPKISLGTVYRNLTVLAETGEIQRIQCGDSSEHFDGVTAQHPHFVCRKCFAVTDLHIDDLSFLNTLAERNVNGQIEKHQLIFYGKCNSCLNIKK
ncbi:MAG: transcriptional repressor [Lachnospiraceae bacterium]